MKSSLIHWSVVLGLLGSSLVGPSILKTTSAVALPEGEVVKRLQQVPVFTIINEKGDPIPAVNPDKKDGPQVVAFFTQYQDAKTVVNQLNSRDPKAGTVARVKLLALSQAYEVIRDNQKIKDKVIFQLLPAEQQVNAAISLLKQQGQKVQEFSGVPLFYATSTNGKTKGLLQAVDQNKKPFVPLYFSQQALQAALDQAKKQNPKLGATRIEVATLGQVVDSMLKQNDPAVSQIRLVPSLDKEAVEFIQSQEQSASNNQPAPAPK